MRNVNSINRRQFGLIAATGIGGSLFRSRPAAAADPQQSGLQSMAESVIDGQALNFVEGPWGTCINGQTFQEHAVATHRGHQYAVYFHASRRLGLARRKLPDGPWEHLLFDDYRIDHNDVHNVAVLGICPGDGTIHLAFDHHGHPLHYRVSKPGAAHDPALAPWTPGLFGPITGSLDRKARLEQITYPMFAPGLGDGLLLYYRTGGSGDGDWHFAQYDPATSHWGPPLRFLSSKGNFHDSLDRCAYLNGLQYDAQNRLHATWCWRESPDLKSNHDLAYAFSDDQGKTWKNNDGQAVGTQDSPLSVQSPGIVVVPIPLGWGMMNQLTQDVDAEGRVHVVLWHNPLNAPGPNHDLNAWRFYHYRREPNGQWLSEALPFFGRKPRLVVDDAGNALLVFTKGTNLDYHGQDNGGKLHVAAATAKARWTDWRIVYSSERDYVGEPRVDLLRWRAEQVLSVYAQQKPD
ncbi:MAG: BNR repeat-containing protein, partial [Thermoguttaceae bacterium]